MLCCEERSDEQGGALRIGKGNMFVAGMKHIAVCAAGECVFGSWFCGWVVGRGGRIVGVLWGRFDRF